MTLLRPTVTRMVAENIARRIISGELKGGEQLRQDAMAKELGVSRVPVREALLQLEAEGLVSIHAHRGAVVSMLSREHAEEVFDTREVLELLLLEKGIDQATEADDARIAKAIDAYDRAVHLNPVPNELSQLNWAIHIGMMEPSRRVRSLALLKSLYSSLDRYVELQIAPLEAQKKAVQDHHEIFGAYRVRDKERFLELSRTHIRNAAREVLGHVGNLGAS
jgi:DNA-binding GntR family transcriptional regulator